jgi:hypothetical protein
LHVITQLSGCRELSVSFHHHLCLNCCELMNVPCPSFCENSFSKTQRYPKSKVKLNVLKWSDKVKIVDLLKPDCLQRKLGGIMGSMNGASVLQCRRGCNPSVSSVSSTVISESQTGYTKSLLYILAGKR